MDNIVSMSIRSQGLQANPFAIKPDIIKPTSRQASYNPPGLVESIHVLTDAKIRIDGRQHVFYARRRYPPVHAPRLHSSSLYNSAVNVYPVHFYVAAKPFYALGIMLTIELFLIKPCAQKPQPTAEFGNDIGKKRGFVVCDKHKVVHESFKHDPL